MPLKQIRIATRKSPLAMKQTELVKAQLLEIEPSLEIILVPFQTQGDKFLNQSLSKIGGKGLFVKELETALLENNADLAVHSMKDVPYKLPDSLGINAILKREDPRDALITELGENIMELPKNAKVGTSSLRRACQLKALRSDIAIVPLRGNINTRLTKRHEFDAIILAAAGLNRMNFENYITQVLPQTQLLPAAGQGALGLECRDDDLELIELLTKLNCKQTQICVEAERGVIQYLQGSCQVPLAAFATINNSELELNALVGLDDGSQILRAVAIEKTTVDPVKMGHLVAKDLLNQGAQQILNKYIN